MRYYSPGVGRFISRDPSGESGGLDLYNYCGNDPINFTDASGLSPVDGFVKAGDNHFYPLYLGGSNSQPLGFLNEVQHRQFHNFLEKNGLGFTDGNGAAARAKWAAMTEEEQWQTIVQGAKVADLTDEQLATLNASRAEIMAGANPGTSSVRNPQQMAQAPRLWDKPGASAAAEAAAVDESATASVASKAAVRVGGDAAIEQATGAASVKVAGAPPGSASTVTLKALGGLCVFLTLKAACDAAGEDDRFRTPINAPYFWSDGQGSVFIVQEVSGWFTNSYQRAYVAGKKAGQSVQITEYQANGYQQIAEQKYGKYIEGGIFSNSKFIPGTDRKSLPLFDPLTGREGWVDEAGEHYYPKGMNSRNTG